MRIFISPSSAESREIGGSIPHIVTMPTSTSCQQATICQSRFYEELHLAVSETADSGPGTSLSQCMNNHGEYVARSESDRGIAAGDSLETASPSTNTCGDVFAAADIETISWTETAVEQYENPLDTEHSECLQLRAPILLSEASRSSATLKRKSASPEAPQFCCLHGNKRSKCYWHIRELGLGLPQEDYVHLPATPVVSLADCENFLNESRTEYLDSRPISIVPFETTAETTLNSSIDTSSSPEQDVHAWAFLFAQLNKENENIGVPSSEPICIGSLLPDVFETLTNESELLAKLSTGFGISPERCDDFLTCDFGQYYKLNEHLAQNSFYGETVLGGVAALPRDINLPDKDTSGSLGEDFLYMTSLKSSLSPFSSDNPSEDLSWNSTLFSQELLGLPTDTDLSDLDGIASSILYKTSPQLSPFSSDESSDDQAWSLSPSLDPSDQVSTLLDCLEFKPCTPKSLNSKCRSPATRQKVFNHRDRRYSCQYCVKYDGERAFKRKDHLVQHLRTFHCLSQEDLVPGFCPHETCSNAERPRSGVRAFASFREYANHLRKVHGESLFSCSFPGCRRVGERGYAGEANLLNHQRKKHPQVMLDS